MTLHMGAAGSPAAGLAMAAYMLEKQVSVETMRSAAYYGRTDHVDAAIAADHGAAPALRADVDPALADALGLVPGGAIDELALGHILSGRRADGEALPVAHAEVTTFGGGEGEGPARHRVAYVDLTYSAPKPVSLAWAFAETDAERASLLQAHRTATAEALAYVEKHVVRARMGKGGEGGTEAGRIAAITVDHYTARPTRETVRTDPTTGELYTELTSARVAGDPALHSHVLVPNVVATESGRFSAIDTVAFHGRIHESGAVYQAVLGRELRALGVEVAYDERTNTLRLPAIPEAAVVEFSKRSREGEREARRRAREEGVEWDALTPEQQANRAKVGTHATRLDKETNTPDWVAWQGQAERINWKHTTVLTGAPPPPADGDRVALASEAGLGHLADMLGKRAVLGQGDARLAAARGFIEHGIGHTDEIGTMMRAWSRGEVHQQGQWTKLIVGHGERGAIRMTTALHRDQEREVMTLAAAAQLDRRHSLPPEALAAAIHRVGVKYEGAAGAQQRAAVEALGTDGAIGAMVGLAGSGKTYGVLPPLVDAWTAQGLEVWGTAQAWRQARALSDTGIARGRTRALQPFLDGVAEGRTRLGVNSVVVVDEIGQVGTRQLLDLLRLRAAHGFKLVVLGDDKQSQAIEAGSVLGLLRAALGEERVPQILETVRQLVESERAIATLFREGKASEAIEQKRAMGTAELVPGGYREAVLRVADLYAERRAATAHLPGYEITISAPTNVDAREIAREVRERRRAMGEVGPDLITVASTDGRGGGGNLDLAVGDNVRLFAQARGVFTDASGKRTAAGAVVGDNGTVLRVEGIAPGEGLTVRTPSGKRAFLPWEAVRDRSGSGRLLLAHGDVLTIDSSQGITSHEHINALPAGSSSVTGFKAYVAESRHRLHSYMVGSMGAEMREVATRRMSGLPRMTTDEEVGAAWENLVRNLAKQPTKESALAFLTAAAGRRQQAAKTLQAGLRTHEARMAHGHQATTVCERAADRVVREALPRVAEAVAGMAATGRETAQAIEAMGLAPPVLRPQTAPVPTPGVPPETVPVPASPAKVEVAPTVRQAPQREPPARLTEFEAQTQFADKMREYRLLPKGLPVMDGVLHYVPVEGDKGRQRSGAYKGYFDGGKPSGAIYNFKLGGFVDTWTADAAVSPMTPEERAVLAAQAAAAATARAAARAAREDTAAAAAQSLVAGARPAPADHPYLVAKGVDVHGLYVGVKGQTVTVTQEDGTLRHHSIAGRLLVPLVNGDGVIRNVQTIAADGTKLYLSGAQKIGTFHTLGEVRPGEPVGVAEGYATAASVHRANGMTVRMALDTSNLGPVAHDLRARDPGVSIFMVADNDHHLPLRVPAPGRAPLGNAGLDKAEAVAKEVGGKVLVPPIAAAQAAIDKGTDWNDLERVVGREAMARELSAQVLRASSPVEAARPAQRPSVGA